MALTASFVESCRAAHARSAEYAAFRAALAALQGAGESDRARLWLAAYGDGQAGGSPARRAREELRRVVADQAGQTSGVTAADREAAYRLLAAEFAPPADRPRTRAAEDADLRELVTQALLQ